MPFLLILYIGNKASLAIRHKMHLSLEMRYCGVPLYSPAPQQPTPPLRSNLLSRSVTTYSPADSRLFLNDAGSFLSCLSISMSVFQKRDVPKNALRVMARRRVAGGREAVNLRR